LAVSGKTAETLSTGTLSTELNALTSAYTPNSTAPAFTQSVQLRETAQLDDTEKKLKVAVMEGSNAKENPLAKNNPAQLAQIDRTKEEVRARTPAESQNADSDAQLPAKLAPAPVPQPEIQTRENAFSTFSLNVSDVSFKLAAASLEKGAMPEPGWSGRGRRGCRGVGGGCGRAS
jgi:hypothetical protein